MTDETPDVTARARAALDGREMAVAMRTAYFRTAAGARLNCSDADAWDRAADVASNLVRDLADKVERQESMHKWPKTTPEGHLYVAPTTYAELCSRHTDAAQASVECWVDAECPPEPTWEMVGLAHREVERLTAERDEARAEVERLTAERDQAIAAHQRAEARATLHREERVRRALGEADRD